jgi:hypothetical protein
MTPGPTTAIHPSPLGIGGAGISARIQGSKPERASEAMEVALDLMLILQPEKVTVTKLDRLQRWPLKGRLLLHKVPLYAGFLGGGEDIFPINRAFAQQLPS